MKVSRQASRTNCETYCLEDDGHNVQLRPKSNRQIGADFKGLGRSARTHELVPLTITILSDFGNNVIGNLLGCIFLDVDGDPGEIH